MDETRLVHVSKYLSKYLRHQPERIGLELEPGGWVDVAAVLTAAAAHGLPITRAELDEVVARNNKQRFGFDETGTRIRAHQGHSVDVAMDYTPTVPPETLYHGTGERSRAPIEREGLRAMRRQYVHLSADFVTAKSVGARHGRPVVFVVDAGAMHRTGHVFYRSANGVWLVARVPAEYLRLER